MKKTNLLWLLPVVALIFLISACATPTEIEEDFEPIVEETKEIVNLETLVKSNQSGYQEEGRHVIDNQEDWDNLWTLASEDELPVVNFEEEMVLAVFMGMRSTGGYSIEMVEIIEKDEVIEVMIEETVPGEDDMVAMVITYPEHIVKIEKTDKPIVFY